MEACSCGSFGLKGKMGCARINHMGVFGKHSAIFNLIMSDLCEYVVPQVVLWFNLTPII